MNNVISFSLCPSPEMYHMFHKEENTIVIVVDILRATSTIVTAIGNGASRIIPVATIEECERLGLNNEYITAAERNAQKCDFSILGNDPYEYSEKNVKGKTIVMTTTNGTKSINIVKQFRSDNILIGAILNLQSTAQYIQKYKFENVIIVAAGWNGQPSIEDCMYSAYLSNVLIQMGFRLHFNDMATMVDILYNSHKKSMHKIIHLSEHYKRLKSAKLTRSADFCFILNLFDFCVKVSDEGFLIRV